MLIADLTAERASMLALAFSMKEGSAAISSFAEVGEIFLGDLEGGSLRFSELFSLKVLGEYLGHTSIQKGFEALLEHELVGFVGKVLEVDFQTLTSFRDFDIHGAHYSSIFGVVDGQANDGFVGSQRAQALYPSSFYVGCPGQAGLPANREDRTTLY